MSEIWHAERMYIQAIQTDNGTFVAQAFSLDDAAAIAREHNAHGAMLDALKAVVQFNGDEPCRADHHGNCQTHSLEPIGECWFAKVKAAIALATDSGTAEGGER